MRQIKNRAGSKAGSKAALLVLLACMMLIAACGGANPPAANETPSGGAQQGGQQGGQQTTAPSGGGQSEEADPFGAYEQPVELTTFRCINESMGFPEGDSIDDNAMYRLIKDELNIQVTNVWTVANSQCEEKTNLSIVSNDLPDFFPVNAKQLKTLVDAGQLEDMTDVIEQYGSPFLKEIYAANDSLMLKPVTFGGKIMAIPGTSRGLNSVDLLWIREDWRKKLNLPEPKTMDDLINIIMAFVEQDPDGNGKKDTFGLNIANDLYGGYSGLLGFFAGFHAYPYASSSTSMWIKGDDGKLVYGGIQPEMKAALAKLQELYKAGAIDPQFVVYDAAKSAENEKQGKTGVHYGQTWVIGWPIDPNDKKNDPEMEWRPYPLVSIDDQPALVPVADPTSFWYFAVKKGVKHPEAVVKMLNLVLEKVYGENAEPEKYHTLVVGDSSYPVFQYSPVQVEHPDKNRTAWKKVNEALQSGDTSALNPEQLKYYNDYQKYHEGDVNYWGADRTWGPEGSYAVVNFYHENNRYIVNEFIGAPTETMSQKGSILMDMEKQMITKIIMGEPVDTFDQFVESWKQSGGDQITQEINEWYANR